MGKSLQPDTSRLKKLVHTNGTARRGGHLHRQLRLLKLAVAPQIVLQLVFLVARQPLLSHVPVYDFVEYFAGAHEATKAAWRRQKMAAAFEIDHDPDTMNMVGGLGYVNAIHLATRLKRLAQSVLAPVCSSWVPINMGTSCRSVLNPLGNRSLSYVKQANIMVSRTVLLVWSLVAMGVLVILEQPMNSLMQNHPRFKQWMLANDIYRYFIRMRDYGAASEKGTWIYSQYPWVGDISRFKAPRKDTPSTVVVATTYLNSKGKSCFKGGKDLKASQKYPRGFGEALQKLFELHKADIRKHVADLEQRASHLRVFREDLFGAPSDDWADADLAPVFDILLQR